MSQSRSSSEARSRRVAYSTLLGLALALCACTGCLANLDVAVRPIFRQYDKVAIWPGFAAGRTEGGLQRIHEELFLPVYMRAFPQQQVVERRDMVAVIGEQDILPDRLDEESRARIRRILGVKAIIFPNYTPGAPAQLAIKVIDTETGIVTAAVCMRQSPGRNGDSGDLWEQLIRRAIAALEQAAGRTR